MAKLIWRQEAIDDLTEIWQYTVETWSENQANTYYEAIRLACMDISQNPERGSKYLEISRSLRGYKINKHIIFYHVMSPDEIEIIRILHERMDLRSHLNPS